MTQEEQEALRAAVAELGAKYGHRYYVEKAKTGGHTTELWAEAGKLGYLGVSVPAEYGGGGGGITELAIVMRGVGGGRVAAAAARRLAGDRATIIARHGTGQQRKELLPGFADGTLKVAFAITEPEAGIERRTGSAPPPAATAATGCISGRKCFISGVDEAAYDAGRGPYHGTDGQARARAVPRADRRPGMTKSKIDMEIVSPENQWMLYLDDVRVPADALIGDGDSVCRPCSAV